MLHKKGYADGELSDDFMWTIMILIAKKIKLAENTSK